MTKGKSQRGCDLIITERASILVLILITSIIILIRQSLWRRRWRGNETTKARLSAGNMTNSDVNLTYLIGEIVKTSTKSQPPCTKATP